MQNSNTGSSLSVRFWNNHNLSTRAMGDMLKSWRPKTLAQYRVYQRRWKTLCLLKGLDPLKAEHKFGLDFLCELCDTGLRCNTLNTARSALSYVLGMTDRLKFGCHPLTIRLLQSFYNQRPPQARYSSIWNVQVVLDYLRELTPLCSLSLKMLTFDCDVIIVMYVR